MEELQEKQISLTDYIRMIRRGRWIIIGSFFLVMAVTVYITFTTKPVYESYALIMVKEEGGIQNQLFEMTSFGKQETMINNHIEILKSRTVAEDVITRLQVSTCSDSLWILGNKNDDDKFSIQQKFKSLIMADEDTSEELNFDLIVKGFREGAISVVPKRDTDLIELHVQALSPFEAAYIANTWMDSYIEMDIRDSRGEVSEIRQFLEDKLKDIKGQLTGSENALKAYQEKAGVAELTAETEQIIQQAAAFETLYQEAKTELEANERTLEKSRSRLDESQKSTRQNILTSPVIQELQRQQGQLIAAKASYEEQLKSTDYYTPDDPKLKAYEQRLQGLQAKLREEMTKMVAGGAEAYNPLNLTENLLASVLELEAENSSLKARTSELQKIVWKYNREMNSLPEKQVRFAQLRRESEVNNNIYMMLREKYEENRIAEVGQIGSVREIDRAKPPEKPIKPKKKMNLILGFMVGIGLGVGIVFLKEYLDNSVKSVEDLEQLGFSVLGSIPFITSQTVGTNGQNGDVGEVGKIESRLITHFAPKSPISEAYRSLRTNLQFAQADKRVRVALVTSSLPGEGKSTTVANLAITFAQMGARTLLIDADLRRPVQHGIFGHSRNVGLTNVLVGRVTLEEAANKTRIDGLSLLSSGTLPPNPSELINSSMMEQLIAKCRANYDMVLFDTPPVIAVTDSAVLSTKLDGVVLVIRSAETAKDALQRSVDLIGKVNGKVLGILLNGVQVSQMYGSYYHYYQYYYYAGDGKDQKKRMKKPKMFA